MQLNVNGIDHEIAALLTPLLHVLREELGITSPKACLQGGCGACTVLVDGEPRRACLMPVAAVNGAEVTTLEGRHAGAAGPDPTGLRPPLRHAVRLLHARHPARGARAHRARRRRRPGVDLEVARGACLPLYRVREDRERRRRGRTRRELRPDGDNGHADDDARDWRCRMKAVGARLPRYDGVAHVTGRTTFVDDVRVPGTLGRRRFAPPCTMRTSRASTPPRQRRCRVSTRSSPGRTCRFCPTGTCPPWASPRTSRCWRRTTCATRASPSRLSPPRTRRQPWRPSTRSTSTSPRSRRCSTSASAPIPTRRSSTSGATGIRTSRARWTSARSARATSTGPSTGQTSSCRASTGRPRSSTARSRRRSARSCPSPTGG